MTLWPGSLAVRLSILLIVTLAAAQLGLTLLLDRERDSVVEELVHSEALNQTVTLARLLNEGLGDDDRLLAAFGSRRTCAAIVTAAGDAAMSGREQQLAQTLQAMLHGIDAGTPHVAISSGADTWAACGAYRGPPALDGEDNESVGRESDDGDTEAALSMDVPLLDGRWLRVVTAIEFRQGPNTLALISFLVSSLAVAVVAVLVVRWQTAGLRTLAIASDRFGRGEAVLPLPNRGPSEVVKAIDAFNTMRARLTQFMQDRIQLLAGVSHDLRTPLTTLRLKAELIDDESARDDLISTIDELTTISEATLAFTRSEATSEPTVTLDLSELLGEVIAEFELGGAAISAGDMANVTTSCRPVALKRAIRNLVENALRYGDAARLSVAAEDGDAVIQIDDDGPGIPPHLIADAFKPFVRLEPSRNAETGGIGLGLAVAQGIVHAHGGTLTLQNLPRGMRAEIRLPRG